MRFIACLVIALLFATVADAQDFFTAGPAESRRAEEATAQVEVQKRMIADLRLVIKTLEAKRCPCCESGECQCAKAAKQWKIVMESIPNCDGCKWADENQRPHYQSLGWLWETKHLLAPQPGVRMYPRYLICNGDTCEVIEIEQYVTELDAKLTALLQRRQPQHDKRGRFLGNW